MRDALVAFVKARLDEDEAMARACTERQPYDEWDAVGAGDADDVALSNWRVAGIAIPGLKKDHAPAARSIMLHVARHDPARVLREVKTWRRLLPEYSIPPGTDAKYGGTEQETGFRLALSFALKAKAMEWSDHLDYPSDGIWPPAHSALAEIPETRK